MISKSELVKSVEALAIELLRGADICTDDKQPALALVMDDAASGLLALLDMLAGTTAGAICGRKASA